jgi:2'-5' RNA ligase
VRTLYTLAYPMFSEADMSFIEHFRQEHDARHRDVVAPHVTLAFGCNAVAEVEYLPHVEAVAQGNLSINFSCRYAMLGADDQDQIAYVFLVPDEGYSKLSLLHDRLYTGTLSPHLRLDVPFIPHITIGSLADRPAAKQLCDELNERGVGMIGSVNALTVAALENGKVRNLASFQLRTKL